MSGIAAGTIIGGAQLATGGKPFGLGADKTTTGSSTNNFNTSGTNTGSTTGNYNNGGSTQVGGNQFINPYIGDYMKRGLDLSNTGADKSVAGFNQNQKNAFGMINGYANSGNPLDADGQQQMQDTISGKYMNPANNPALKASMDAALGNVRSTLGGSFSGNNFGGSAHEELLNKQSMAAMAPIMNNERNNQMTAMGMAPQYTAGVNSNNYNNANQLLNVGNQQQNQQQNVLDDPYKKYQQFGNVINQGIGMGSDTTNLGFGSNTGTTTGTNNTSGTSNGTTTGTVQGNPWADVAGLIGVGAGAAKLGGAF